MSIGCKNCHSVKMAVVYVGAFLQNVFPYVCCMILFLVVFNKIAIFVISRFRYSERQRQKVTDFSIKPSKIVPDDVDHIPLNFQRLSDDRQRKFSKDFLNFMSRFRRVKSFSDKKISLKVIENVIKTAGTSPSGVHTEPWTFATITNSNLKRQIRLLVENEELKRSKNFSKLDSDHRTTHLLETAPCLIIVFKQVYGINEYGERKTHYQNQVTVAMATGLLIAAFHNVGLSTVPCAPLNAGPAIRTLLARPFNEKALFLLPVGYPNETFPTTNRKNLDEILCVFS